MMIVRVKRGHEPPRKASHEPHMMPDGGYRSLMDGEIRLSATCTRLDKLISVGFSADPT
jgi:hypothetical protein